MPSITLKLTKQITEEVSFPITSTDIETILADESNEYAYNLYAEAAFTITNSLTEDYPKVEIITIEGDANEF